LFESTVNIFVKSERASAERNGGNEKIPPKFITRDFGSAIPAIDDEKSGRETHR
jgi:hypothetical protein